MDSVNDIFEKIQKKWVYHFIISPTTNIIEKPEWYLNQTLKWIHSNLDTLESKIRQSHNDEKRIEIRRLFIVRMLELPHRRLKKDLDTLIPRLDEDSKSESILIHAYNEVIQFIKSIKHLLGDYYYKIDEKQDMMALFSHQNLFERIINVEWDNARRNLRDINSSESKWDPVLDGDYQDYYKIPKCVDRFLLQIKALSERVECFLQLDCQYQLVDLQSYLFKKFMENMKQTTESSTISKNIFTDMFFITDDTTIDLSKILRVLNGVNFLKLILRERCFISSELDENLDKDLSAKLTKTTEEYSVYLNKLIDRVVNTYEQVNCDYHSFLEFVKPKLSHNIYELVHDEAAKIHQTKQTRSMLKGLSFGRE